MSSPAHNSRFVKLLDKTMNFTSSSFSTTPPTTAAPSLNVKSSNSTSTTTTATASERSASQGGHKEELIDKIFSKFRHASSSSSHSGRSKKAKIAADKSSKLSAQSLMSINGDCGGGETTVTSNDDSGGGSMDSATGVVTIDDDDDEYKNKPIETIRKDIHAIFDHLNMSLEEISGSLGGGCGFPTASPMHQVVEYDEERVERFDRPKKSGGAVAKINRKPKVGAKKVEHLYENISNGSSSSSSGGDKDDTSKEFADILNKIDDFCGNRSSKSSINSEEGYYSNHDSSISTQANEQQQQQQLANAIAPITAVPSHNIVDELRTSTKVAHNLSPKLAQKDAPSMRSVKKQQQQQQTSHHQPSNPSTTMHQRTHSTPELFKNVPLSSQRHHVAAMLCQESNLSLFNNDFAALDFADQQVEDDFDQMNLGEEDDDDNEMEEEEEENYSGGSDCSDGVRHDYSNLDKTFTCVPAPGTGRKLPQIPSSPQPVKNKRSASHSSCSMTTTSAAAELDDSAAAAARKDPIFSKKNALRKTCLNSSLSILNKFTNSGLGMASVTSSDTSSKNSKKSSHGNSQSISNLNHMESLFESKTAGAKPPVIVTLNKSKTVAPPEQQQHSAFNKYSLYSPKQFLKGNTSLSKLKSLQSKFHDNFSSYSFNLSFSKTHSSKTAPVVATSLHVSQTPPPPMTSTAAEVYTNGSTGSSCGTGSGSESSSRRQSAESAFFSTFSILPPTLSSFIKSEPSTASKLPSQEVAAMMSDYNEREETEHVAELEIEDEFEDEEAEDNDDEYDSFYEPNDVEINNEDDEDELDGDSLNTNVKNLITKFENRRLVFNKRILNNSVNTKL
jgi:hypothetical protein